MKLLICYLTNDSRHYTFLPFIRLLNASKQKDEWELFVLTHSDDSDFYESALSNFDIRHTVTRVSNENNYMTKIKVAIQYAEDTAIPYIMKCDNDIFLTPQTLDYMIMNLHILNTSSHLTLGPTLSSGIPGAEYFKESFLTDHEAKTLESYFIKTHLYNRDGATYIPLNQYTLWSDSWDKNAFFDGVKQINHHYKGIHPIRINYEAIDYLNTCILNNREKFFDTIPDGLILDDSSPYLCDSIFCIRTDTYKTIVYDTSLFVDAYDEVPLNKYAWKESMNHVFVKNGFAIHILYNWYDNLTKYESEFTARLFA